MKTIKRYALLLAALLSLSTNAQAQVLRNADFEAIGRISPNGMVRDAAAHSLGSFDPDGTIKDKSGAVRGRIQRLEIFDTDGTRIGYINTDGTVRTGESNLLGNISISDGKVTDAQHNVLGFARGIRVDWIACYFFFDFFSTGAAR